MKRRESAPSRSARMATRCIPRHEDNLRMRVATEPVGQCARFFALPSPLRVDPRTSAASVRIPAPTVAEIVQSGGRRVALDPRPPSPADPGPIRTSEGLVQHAEAYTGSARHDAIPDGQRDRAGRPPVSDRGTFGGLTQFLTQFDVSGSATSL